MLPWVRRNHNRITANLFYELRRQLSPDEFEIATGDFAVRTGPDSIRYADVMIEKAGAPGEERFTQEPIVLFEILSASTMHIDFGDKRHEYQALESLKAYVVLAQDESQVWLWQRDSDGNWPADPEQISEGTIVLDAIGAKLELKTVYRGVKA